VDRSHRFGLTLLVFWGAAFAVGVIATPPDPFSQMFVVVLLAILAVPLAYVVVYTMGGDVGEEDFAIGEEPDDDRDAEWDDER
jgi:hypothetical protein